MAVIVTTVPSSLTAATVTSTYEENAASTTAVAPKVDPEDFKKIGIEETLASPLEVSEPTPLDLWLEKLIEKESNHKERVRIVDTNGRYSYGCLQFQEGTFRAYGTRYGLVTPKANIESVVYDCNLQKQIAKRMILEDRSNWQHWYTSVKVKNIGLPPRS